jgi:hypothetical protein
VYAYDRAVLDDDDDGHRERVVKVLVRRVFRRVHCLD